MTHIFIVERVRKIRLVQGYIYQDFTPRLSIFLWKHARLVDSYYNYYYYSPLQSSSKEWISFT